MAVPTTGFRVIIVGGGPVGLLAAHTLSKAGIDFVLLERRDTVQTHQGSSIALGGPTIRLLDQLGLFDVSQKLNHPLKNKYFVTDKGRRFHEIEFGTMLEESHGHSLYFIHRADLLDMLYTTLPEEAKARVLTSKRIAQIESDETRALVACEDGSSYEGSLVLGADGVNSQVRKFMRELALKKDPKAVVDEERPFLTTFRCMFGFGPSPNGPDASDIWECHTTGQCTQMMVGRDKTWFFVYEKLDKPTREKKVYSEKEKEQYAERMGDQLLTDKLTVRDLYKTAEQTILVDLEEGIVRNYSWSRLLLAGDAGVKQTPNAGNGFNNGAQDVALLSNLLVKLLKEDAGSDNVSMEAVDKMLGEYQRVRRKDALETYKRSAMMTRSSTFDKWHLWLLDRYVIPGLGLDKFLFDKMISPAVAKSIVLSYLPETHLLHGKVPWKNMPEAQATVEAV